MKKQAFNKLYQNLFYIQKHEKLSDKVFRCRMVVSLLTILACTVLMASSTFALFFSEVSTDNSTLVGAYYSVTVDNVENGTYICPLVFEDIHTFEIKADGTATTGYCKIQVGEQVYYTSQISQGESLFLIVQAARDTVITVTPQLGTPSDYVIEIIHSTTPSAPYTVEVTAKLSDIAAFYGVSEADILIYNNITEIAVDMALKIPGVDKNVTPYTVPYATYIVEPATELDDIANYYGVSVDDILMYNGITELTVGYELKIPGVSPDIVSYVAPVPQPSADTDENTGEGIPDEKTEPPMSSDAELGGDVGSDEQFTEDQPAKDQPLTEKTTTDEIITEDTSSGDGTNE